MIGLLFERRFVRKESPVRFRNRQIEMLRWARSDAHYVDYASGWRRGAQARRFMRSKP